MADSETKKQVRLLYTGRGRSATAFLIGVLIKIAKQLEKLHYDLIPEKGAALNGRIRSLTQDLPPLPDFSEFHHFFRKEATTPEGDVRTAFYLSYDHQNCEYIPLGPELTQRVSSGEILVSTSFVTPYPPGFPILVPGQVISRDILAFLEKLEVKEIHGYNADLGLRVFKQDVLQSKEIHPVSLSNRAAEKKKVKNRPASLPASAEAAK